MKKSHLIFLAILAAACGKTNHGVFKPAPTADVWVDTKENDTAKTNAGPKTELCGSLPAKGGEAVYIRTYWEPYRVSISGIFASGKATINYLDKELSEEVVNVSDLRARISDNYHCKGFYLGLEVLYQESYGTFHSAKVLGIFSDDLALIATNKNPNKRFVVKFSDLSKPANKEQL